MSVLVREKDILNKANFKLLQLLQLKDKTIKAIIDSVQSNKDSIEMPPMPEGDQQLT